MKEKVARVELPKLAEFARLATPLARFGKVGRAASNRRQRLRQQPRRGDCCRRCTARQFRCWRARARGGTSHRQILDGIEVMEHKQAHHLLFQLLAASSVSSEGVRDMELRIDHRLHLSRDDRESSAEPLFRDLAEFTGKTLARKYPRA